MMFGGNPNKSGFLSWYQCNFASSPKGHVYLLVVSARVFSSYTSAQIDWKGFTEGCPKSASCASNMGATWCLWSTSTYIGTMEKILNFFVLLLNIHYISQPSTEWESLSPNLTLPGLSISSKRPFTPCRTWREAV